MDAQIERHQPLITSRLVFAPKAFPPPPIITARKEFPSISVPQKHRRSATPEIRIPRKTPKRRHATLKSASTPNRRGASVAFEDDVDSESSLSSLSDESDELESEEGVGKKIPKPPGQPGRPQSGGYNLQNELGWNDMTYQSILVSLINVLQSILKKKLTESGAKTGEDEVRHRKKFQWTRYEKN
jgi:hypothetical protein